MKVSEIIKQHLDKILLGDVDNYSEWEGAYIKTLPDYDEAKYHRWGVDNSNDYWAQSLFHRAECHFRYLTQTQVEHFEDAR